VVISGGSDSEKDYLIIQPKDLTLNTDDAFGSGAHPTTALCLDLLHRYLKAGDRFLDVGTGTGILMIVAARLGAAAVAGFDKYHSVALTARINLAANGIPPHLRLVFVADSPACLKLKWRVDLAAVNILPGVILAVLGDLSHIVRPGGVLLCSGMILGNSLRVENGLDKAGFDMVAKERKDLWVGLAARRR
jgi:ribosomal protein L11 methyltransferase